ncbi:MAG TPA: TlpA disulfide reductase family protein [Thermomicrobiales bacterium]
MAPLEVGAQVPPLETAFTDAEGQSHRIADALRRGPVLIGIYKSSCGASKAMMPMLERLHQRYGDQGLTVLGVAQDSANITRSFARRYGITFPLLVEGEDYPISKHFDIFATPTVYVIRPDGTIAFTAMGFLREQVNDLGAAVAAELGRAPEPVVRDDEEEIPLFVPG